MYDKFKIAHCFIVSKNSFAGGGLTLRGLEMFQKKEYWQEKDG